MVWDSKKGHPLGSCSFHEGIPGIQTKGPKRPAIYHYPASSKWPFEKTQMSSDQNLTWTMKNCLVNRVDISWCCSPHCQLGGIFTVSLVIFTVSLVNVSCRINSDGIYVWCVRLEVLVTIVSKLVYKLFTGRIQPTSIGVIIHLLSTMDIPVRICGCFFNTCDIFFHGRHVETCFINHGNIPSVYAGKHHRISHETFSPGFT